MISKTERIICGTCEYWTGNRNPVFDKKGNPKVDIADETGQCENVMSRQYEKSRKRDASCVHFSKWTELF